jgi:putative tryptophan/tyrosine transport system substrate-binding protein
MKSRRGLGEMARMPSRRTFLMATMLGLGVSAPSVFAKSDNKARRIGIVYTRDYGPENENRLWSAFDSELRERGWVEGRNLVVERREFSGNRTQLPGLMAELLALDVELIFVVGVWAALAAKEATDRIPIVFTVGDAIGRGVVTNLARPERNLTGTSAEFVELQAKRVELLQLVAPGIKRIAALQNTMLGYPPAMFQDRNKPPGVEIFIVGLKGMDDLDPAMVAISEWRADAVLVAQAWTRAFEVKLVEAVAKRRLPAIFADRYCVEVGGLLSFGNDFNRSMRINAAYVDKILRGAKPADLPVQQPLAFDLAINLRTAKALAISIPPELVVRANLVIE